MRNVDKKRFKSLLLGTALVFVLFLSYLPLSAQRQDITYFLKEIPQNNSSNPAMGIGYDLYFFAFMPSFEIRTSGFGYNSFIERHEEFRDSLNINSQRFSKNMLENNFLNMQMEQNLLGFGLRKGKNEFTFSSYINVDSRVEFSNTSFDFVAMGMESIVSSMELNEKHLLNLNAYLANAIGYIHHVNKSLSVGVRAKLLFGITNISTSDCVLRFANNEAGGYTAALGLDMKTSNIFNLLDLAAAYGLITREDALPMSIGETLISIFHNIGLALDLGTVYKVNNSLKLGFSVSDLGFISWNSGLKQLRTSEEELITDFEGIDTSLTKYNTSILGLANNIVSSLDEAFDVHEYEMEAYSQFLPIELKVSGEFILSDEHTIQALIGTKFVNNRFIDSHLSAFYAFRSSYVGFSAGNTFMFSSWFNPSVLISLNLKPVGFYLGTSFKIGGNGGLNMGNISSLSLFGGLSLAFGEDVAGKRNRVRRHW